MNNISLEKLGIINEANIFRNLSPALLIEKALEKNEGELASNGALNVNTGKYSGRSPNDRFIVDDDFTHEHINWGKINNPLQGNILIISIHCLFHIYRIRTSLYLTDLSEQTRIFEFPYEL